MNTNLPVYLIAIMLFSAVLVVNSLDKRSEQNQASLYCEMVAEYKASNGQHGWPAYKEGVTCP